VRWELQCGQCHGLMPKRCLIRLKEETGNGWLLFLRNRMYNCAMGARQLGTKIIVSCLNRQACTPDSIYRYNANITAKKFCMSHLSYVTEISL
jgi:hypothetical protein